jgi:hypothetical protein
MEAVDDGYNVVNSVFLSQEKTPGVIHSHQLLDMQMVDAVLVGE